ncbi:MmgE/PrpD family protein [Haloarculaceae archaeon H-GB2-1]|nr:MmgE/PrpD family protein [Haloarculaceae archaeon H-GB2-1]
MATSSFGREHMDRAVEYVHSESLDEIPDEVDEALRRRVLDQLAAVVAGHRVERMDVSTDYAAETYTAGESTILDGSGRERCLEGATLANGLAGNALDIDDGNRIAEGHPAACVVPAALAAAEEQDATIRELLDAVLAGYEVACRTALVLKEWTGMYNGSGSWGAVGAAAAIARLRGYDHETTADALGIAEWNAPINPVMRSVARPGSAMTKDGIGWGGFVGATAANVARRGLNGSGMVFDDEEADPSPLDSLGEEYFLTESYYKPYPGCRWVHSGVDAAFELLDEHGIDAEDIEAVRAYTHWKAMELGTKRPANPDEAEYSYPYMLAVAIVKNDWLTPADFDEAMRTDEGVLDLVDKISLHQDEEAQELYSEKSTSRIEIDADGETYTSELTSPRGSRERPLTDDEYFKKQRVLIDDAEGEGSPSRCTTTSTTTTGRSATCSPTGGRNETHSSSR